MIKNYATTLYSATPTLSYSYQCAMLMSNVDSAIMKIDENKYSSLIEAAKMLEKKVKKLMIMVITYYLKILNAALRLLNI